MNETEDLYQRGIEEGMRRMSKLLESTRSDLNKAREATYQNLLVAQKWEKICRDRGWKGDFK